VGRQPFAAFAVLDSSSADDRHPTPQEEKFQHQPTQRQTVKGQRITALLVSVAVPADDVMVKVTGYVPARGKTW
jgi:hypothetical protein